MKYIENCKKIDLAIWENNNSEFYTRMHASGASLFRLLTKSPFFEVKRIGQFLRRYVDRTALYMYYNVKCTVDELKDWKNTIYGVKLENF